MCGAVDDGFVRVRIGSDWIGRNGMEWNGMERPKGKVAQVVVEGDSFSSIDQHNNPPCRRLDDTAPVGHDMHMLPLFR